MTSKGTPGQDLVIWSGPIGLNQVPGCFTQNSHLFNPACCGKPDPSCPPATCQEVVWQWLDSNKRHLPVMAKIAGMPSLEETGDVILGAFSAGGRVVRDIIGNCIDAARVRAVTMADAIYDQWQDTKKTIPQVDEEWLVWANAVLSSGNKKLWVATSSPSPNYDRPSGVQCLRALRQEIENRTGLRFEELSSFYNITPAPDKAYKLGNIIFAEYPYEPLRHLGHISIQPQIWQNIILPWLAEIRNTGISTRSCPVNFKPGTEQCTRVPSGQTQSRPEDDDYPFVTMDQTAEATKKKLVSNWLLLAVSTVIAYYGIRHVLRQH